MADEPNQNTNTDPSADPARGGEDGKPDYKALYEKAKSNSRKWEERAKANNEKADKYDAASAVEASLENRIKKLEADKSKLEQQRERQAMSARVAAKYGLSEAIVGTLNGADEQTLGEQTKAVVSLKPASAPSAPEAGCSPETKQQGQGRALRRHR